MVPGAPSTSVPITAHGGEGILSSKLVRALEKFAATGGGTKANVVVNVRQSGTVIQQDRDWASLVESISQAVDARMRR
jgi:hypothetical protein